MKLRTFEVVALLIIVIAGVGYLLIDRTRNRQQASRPETNEAQVPSQETTEPGADEDETISSASPDVTKSSLPDPLPEKTRVSEVKTDESQTPAPPRSSRKEDGQEDSTAAAPRVLVYYFHGTTRCATCRKLEAFSLEAVQRGFSEALQRGDLRWQILNVDEPENEHFVDDYQLYTRSLVVAKTSDGKQTEWKNLEKIWELVGDKRAFMSYVQDEIRTYMGDES